MKPRLLFLLIVSACVAQVRGDITTRPFGAGLLRGGGGGGVADACPCSVTDGAFGDNPMSITGINRLQSTCSGTVTFGYDLVNHNFLSVFCVGGGAVLMGTYDQTAAGATCHTDFPDPVTGFPTTDTHAVTAAQRQNCRDAIEHFYP